MIALLAIVFATACFLILAPWQLGKNSDTEHRNDLIRAAAGTAAVPIDELAPAGQPFDTDTEWRSVAVTGRYLPDQQVVVRLRSKDERPAAEVLTPFRVDGSERVILVNRGFVRADDDNVFRAPAVTGEPTTLEGRLRKTEGTSPGKEPRTQDGALTAYTIDTGELADATGLPFEAFYLQLAAEQPGALDTASLPQLDSGPYLSYGLQWLAFGIMVPLGVVYFVYTEVKHRRKVAARSADGDDAGAAAPDLDDARTAERRRIREELREVSTGGGQQVRPAAAGDGPPADDDASAAVKAKLAQRYGR